MKICVQLLGLYIQVMIMPINENQKYPTDKATYDRNYLRAYGKPCIACDTQGYFKDNGIKTTCIICNGVDYIEKFKGE